MGYFRTQSWILLGCTEPQEPAVRKVGDRARFEPDTCSNAYILRKSSTFDIKNM